MEYYCHKCEQTFDGNQSGALIKVKDDPVIPLYKVICPVCHTYDVESTESIHNSSDDDYTDWGCEVCDNPDDCDDCPNYDDRYGDEDL